MPMPRRDSRVYTCSAFNTVFSSSDNSAPCKTACRPLHVNQPDNSSAFCERSSFSGGKSNGQAPGIFVIPDFCSSITGSRRTIFSLCSPLFLTRKKFAGAGKRRSTNFLRVKNKGEQREKIVRLLPVM